ncbi:MAG: GGDEF domain-containing protein, partial [Pseudomonadota bacterium]
SLRDPLTGLYNRRYFTEHLSASLARGLRGGWPVCCVYLDVDHFKRVNDEHGHAAGDAVLCHLAKTLTTQLRSGEVVARYGGEEFCLLLADAKAQTGVAVAERIRASVAKTPIELPSGAWIDLTVSCGVADSCGLNAFEQRTGAQRLLQQADEALYQAKRNGRNRVVSSTVSSD